MMFTWNMKHLVLHLPDQNRVQVSGFSLYQQSNDHKPGSGVYRPQYSREHVQVSETRKMMFIFTKPDHNQNTDVHVNALIVDLIWTLISNCDYLLIIFMIDYDLEKPSRVAGDVFIQSLNPKRFSLH